MNLRVLMMLLLSVLQFGNASAQWNIDKVKNIFGSGKETTSKVVTHLQYLQNPELADRYPGSAAEEKVATYVSDQFKALMFKPYLGQYIQRFTIDKKNNLSEDSYIKIFDHALLVGSEVIIPPFSGVGKLHAQAMTGMTEPDNLWFIKFSEVGDDLNNKYGNGLEKMHLKAQQAIDGGARAVMFLNDVGASSDFTNSFDETKNVLQRPVFILNHDAYKKHILQAGSGRDWIHVTFDFAKARRTMEGHNVIGYWQSQSDEIIVIGARYDKQPGGNANTSGLAALLEIASRINADRLRNYNYLLVAFSGTADERKGAEALIKHMGLNDKKVNCMINIGDVGCNMPTNELFITGTGTATSWLKTIGSLDRNFKLQLIPNGQFGEDNHRSFYNKNIPVINIFGKRAAGNVQENVTNIEKAAQAIGDMLLDLDNLPKLSFTPTQEWPDLKKQKFEVNIGLEPDAAFAGEGVLVGEVFANSAAAFSNLMTGDVIVQIGDYDIRDLNDYVRELKKYSKGNKVMLRVMRKGEKKEVFITFK